jgi:hypothetical protein
VGEAIGQSLPLAIGVALSPIPIIAVVLMLTTPRARADGPAFVLGWLVGLGRSARSCWRSPARPMRARRASRRPG